ncbi:MAG: hypothetical protein R3F54_24410 [Alphaproteobacteria bacterium]
MTGMLDTISDHRAAGERIDAGRHPAKGPIFPTLRPAMVTSRLSMVGMALGYLGLVAMLSTAPYWHQAMAPHQSHVAACTDVGGSR